MKEKINVWFADTEPVIFKEYTELLAKEVEGGNA